MVTHPDAPAAERMLVVVVVAVVVLQGQVHQDLAR